jgi:hypothetical protein
MTSNGEVLGIQECSTILRKSGVIQFVAPTGPLPVDRSLITWPSRRTEHRSHMGCHPVIYLLHARRNYIEPTHPWLELLCTACCSDAQDEAVLVVYGTNVLRSSLVTIS